MKEESKLVGIMALILVVPSIVLRGFVLTKLWAWFAAPTFGLPNLDIPVAIGLSLVVGFLTYQQDLAKDENASNTVKLITSIIGPLFVLFMGWIITLFM